MLKTFVCGGTTAPEAVGFGSGSDASETTSFCSFLICAVSAAVASAVLAATAALKRVTASPSSSRLMLSSLSRKSWP